MDDNRGAFFIPYPVLIAAFDAKDVGSGIQIGKGGRSVVGVSIGPIVAEAIQTISILVLGWRGKVKA